MDHAPTAEKMKLLQNPFTSGIENVPTELQLQFIELSANENLKEYFKESYENAVLLPFYSRPTHLLQLFQIQFVIIVALHIIYHFNYSFSFKG